MTVPTEHVTGVVPLNAMSQRYYYYTCTLCSQDGERVEHFERLTQQLHEFLAKHGRTIRIVLPPELLEQRPEMPPYDRAACMDLVVELYMLSDAVMGECLKSLAEGDEVLAGKLELLKQRFGTPRSN